MGGKARYTIEAGKVSQLTLGEDAFNKIAFCRDGPMLFNTNDAYVGRSLELYREYCPEEQAILLRLFPEGGTVIEVGANIGSHTVGLAKRAGRVIAFEPQRVVFQALCANLALNQLDNVDARQQACGSVGHVIEVPLLDPRSLSNFGGVSLIEEGQPAHTVGTEFVTLARLDGITEQADLIKIDAEGMEIDVLRGAIGIVRHCKPTLYVECDRQSKAAELVALLRELDYHLYWHTPRLYSPLNYAGNPYNAFGGVASINLLCRPKAGDESFGLRPVNRHDDLWGTS